MLGTSLQEGERIELQLRGRAGRQGDPGTTQLLFDVSDPLIINYGMQSECVWWRKVGGCDGRGSTGPFVESTGRLMQDRPGAARWVGSVMGGATRPAPHHNK